MEIPSVEIYGIRMLVFIETEPQSNIYNQVYLTPERFKQISGLIGEKVKNESGIEIKNITTSEEEYKLPDLKEMDNV